MKMTFDRATVDALIAHAKAAPTHRMPFGDEREPQAGLWIVGDIGIYLLSNGVPALMLHPDHPDEAMRLKGRVAYATQCDPTRMSPEACDSVKRRAWGGDDEVTFIALAGFEKALATYPPGAPLEMSVTRNALGIYSRTPPRPRAKAAA